MNLRLLLGYLTQFKMDSLTGALGSELFGLGVGLRAGSLVNPFTGSLDNCLAV